MSDATTTKTPVTGVQRGLMLWDHVDRACSDSTYAVGAVIMLMNAAFDDADTKEKRKACIEFVWNAMLTQAAKPEASTLAAYFAATIVPRLTVVERQTMRNAVLTMKDRFDEAHGNAECTAKALMAQSILTAVSDKEAPVAARPLGAALRALLEAHR